MKRSVIFAFAFLLIAFSSFAQVAANFRTFEKEGASVKSLDRDYPGGIWLLQNPKVISPALDPEQAYSNAYNRMLQDLGKFLKKNNFVWAKATHGFNRIYFNPDGTVAYFLYNFKPGQLQPEKEQQFNNLLTKFIKNYRFTYPLNTRFAQCSAVVYTP